MNQESGPSAESGIHFLHWFDEYRELLRRHGIEFDERHIWDCATDFESRIQRWTFVLAYPWDVAPG